jgi:hypothetical protein
MSVGDGNARLYTMISVRPPTTIECALMLAAALTLCSVSPSAHKTVVSQYTFNAHILPILRDRCGRCHVDGGVAPTLLRYPSAKAAAWQIQQVLLSGRSHPWTAEAESLAFKGVQQLRAREFDALMTWASGGTPEGTAAVARREVPAPHWPLGSPDEVMTMPEPFTLEAGTAEADQEITWPAEAMRGKWIRAVDLRPGTGSMVRRATVAIRSGDEEQTVGLWIPGDVPQPLAGDGAFEVPGGASLVLRVHYQRPTAGEAGALTDRSQVAVYFAPASRAHTVSAIEIHGDGDWPHEMKRVFTQPIDNTVRVVALRPISGPPDAGVRLAVIAADGSRHPLARLQLRPEWPRRYAFVTPLVLTKGSRVEATVTASYGRSWMTLTGDRGVGPTEGGPFRLLLEIIR